MNKKLLLASSSPYRKKLLERLGLPFETAKPLCDEDALKNAFTGNPGDLCGYLAEHKAKSLLKTYPEHTIIGSDQSLLFEEWHLGKGHNFEGAFEQLTQLAGKTATLITAVHIISPEISTSFECNTKLNFKDLTPKQIEAYLKTDKPYDCAGSFKIEKKGFVLFESLKTEDPSSIEGLPLIKLSVDLEARGFEVF